MPLIRLLRLDVLLDDVRFGRSSSISPPFSAIISAENGE